MPAALALSEDHVDVVDTYVAAMQAVGKKTGHSTVQAARSFCAKTERAGGFHLMSRTDQTDAVRKATLRI